MIPLAIVGGGAAALGITAIVTLFMVSRGARATERELGEAKAKISALEGKLLAATTSAEGWRDIAKDRDAKILNLTELIDDIAKDLPPDGARARMHARWFAIHNPANTGTTALELMRGADSDPAQPIGDRLLKPGE